MERDTFLLEQTRRERERRLRERLPREFAAGGSDAEPAAPDGRESDSACFRTITSAVWETLAVTNPEGIDRASLEAISRQASAWTSASS